MDVIGRIADSLKTNYWTLEPRIFLQVCTINEMEKKPPHNKNQKPQKKKPQKRNALYWDCPNACLDS